MRVIAFIAVITGSVLLARPDKPANTRTQDPRRRSTVQPIPRTTVTVVALAARLQDDWLGDQRGMQQALDHVEEVVV